jgi:hypothetical protein
MRFTRGQVRRKPNELQVYRGSYAGKTSRDDSGASHVKDVLDELLGYRNDRLATPPTTTFVASVQGHHFLIVGVEVWRGGGAISEDAISFRVQMTSCPGQWKKLCRSLRGFTVERLMGPTGPASGEIIRQDYAVTIDGPQETGEWKGER